MAEEKRELLKQIYLACNTAYLALMIVKEAKKSLKKFNKNRERVPQKKRKR